LVLFRLWARLEDQALKIRLGNQALDIRFGHGGISAHLISACCSDIHSRKFRDEN